MKAALVFAGSTAAASCGAYRAPGFLGALAEAGIEPVLIDLDVVADARFASPGCAVAGVVSYRNHADRLALIVSQEHADVVQTFGATADLGPVWDDAARAAVPLVHFVGSAGAVGERAGRPGVPVVSDFSGPRGTLAHWHARIASRHVAGVVGSNRADLGRHFRHGFFSRAGFSVVAPPPTPRDRPAAAAAAAPRRSRESGPVLGFFDPEADGAALDMLFQAVALTGQAGTFSLHLAPESLSGRAKTRSGATFVAAATADAFVRAIDVLVVPRADDRVLPTIVSALRARKSVIVPDTGAATEIVDYGRCGLLYPPDSVYHLAMAINVMTQAWDNRPFSFEGVDDAIARTAPAAVAAVFVGAWRRLAAGRERGVS